MKRLVIKRVPDADSESSAMVRLRRHETPMTRARARFLQPARGRWARTQILNQFARKGQVDTRRTAGEQRNVPRQPAPPIEWIGCQESAAFGVRIVERVGAR